MRVVEKYAEVYQDDQLVVELRDARLVLRELQRLDLIPANPGPPRTSPELGLAMIDLPELETLIRPLRRNGDLVFDAKATRRPPYTMNDELSDLDLLLFKLRRDFRAAYDGWTPTMGKNRTLDLIEGWPYIKGGTEGPLEPVRDVKIPPRDGSVGPRVGVLDTRLYAHPDLVGRYVGDAITTLDPPTESPLGHATFIAGLVLRRAHNAELVVQAVLDDRGTSRDSWDVATKIVGVRDAGVAVMNLSFGCATADREPPLVLSRAVERTAPLVVLVAAAGNHGLMGPEPDGDTKLSSRTPMWPAALDGVVAVGAHDGTEPTPGKAPFSPRRAPWIDLMAPGVGERSTFLTGEVEIMVHEGGALVSADTKVFPEGYAQWSGTSFAAANVTGQIAAMMADGRNAREALRVLLDRTGPDSGGDIWAPDIDEVVEER